MTAISDPARLALELAALGWHILPLSPASKRPLGNCPACRTRHGIPGHHLGGCPCLVGGRWCHGVRAATTDPALITAWWRREPRAVPGAAAGPSGLVLVDVDNHGGRLPSDLATGLLPGIDLAAESVPRNAWDDPARYRGGRDALALLARLRGGTRPWPRDPGHQPVSVATPSGGSHLWYAAPAIGGLHQVLADPAGRRGLAWQVDIKAGWSYGVAPGAVTSKGNYTVTGGDLLRPGRMPGWLAGEIQRVIARRPAAPVPLPGTERPAGRGPAAYLAAVIARGAAQLAAMTDGRQRALSALAYHAGGLLGWSGASCGEVTSQLIDAGTASGLPVSLATRIVRRAVANGIERPLLPPGSPAGIRRRPAFPHSAR
jgi:hypothetical protein